MFFFQIPGNVEYHPKNILYSKRQHLFLVVYEFNNATNEVIFYWENTDSQTGNSKSSTVKGLSMLYVFVFAFSVFPLIQKIHLENNSYQL